MFGGTHMKKARMILAAFFMISLTACGESGITVTGDNATITTNAEHNNAQAIVDTDVSADVDVTDDKSSENSNNTEIHESITIEDNDEYQKLKNDYDKILGDNEKLNEEIRLLKEENSIFKQQKSELPNFEFKDIGLSIDGNTIPIDKTRSAVEIDNKTYYSEEFIDSLLDADQKKSIQDETMYIGVIVKNKALLTEQYEYGHSYASVYNSVTDSFGKLRTNAIVFDSGKSSITYNLNREFAMFRFSLSIKNNANDKGIGTLTVKADDEIVYTSPELTKSTEKIDIPGIPINNCLLLTLEYNSYATCDCIMSDMEIYNE